MTLKDTFKALKNTLLALVALLIVIPSVINAVGDIWISLQGLPTSEKEKINAALFEAHFQENPAASEQLLIEGDLGTLEMTIDVYKNGDIFVNYGKFIQWFPFSYETEIANNFSIISPSYALWFLYTPYEDIPGGATSSKKVINADTENIEHKQISKTEIERIRTLSDGTIEKLIINKNTGEVISVETIVSDTSIPITKEDEEELKSKVINVSTDRQEQPDEVIAVPAGTQEKTNNEHLPYGTTSSGSEIKQRTAYVMQYNSEYRIPNWVAYHIIPEYRKSPKRKGRFKKFRKDTSVDNPVVTADYTNQGYARGHLAPYFISGGDRDGDGNYAKLEGESDEEDEQTVFEINYMTNISPQHQVCFNGAGGVWYKLETFIRKKLIEEGQGEVWVYTGSIFDDELNKMEPIGPEKNIQVPNSFFKIVLQKQNDGELTALAFKFPHYIKDESGECNDLDRKFYDAHHLTTVNEIERLTKIDFFKNMEDESEEFIEKTDSMVIWNKYYKSLIN